MSALQTGYMGPQKFGRPLTSMAKNALAAAEKFKTQSKSPTHTLDFSVVTKGEELSLEKLGIDFKVEQDGDKVCFWAIQAKQDARHLVRYCLNQGGISIVKRIEHVQINLPHNTFFVHGTYTGEQLRFQSKHDNTPLLLLNYESLEDVLGQSNENCNKKMVEQFRYALQQLGERRVLFYYGSDTFPVDPGKADPGRSVANMFLKPLKRTNTFKNLPEKDNDTKKSELCSIACFIHNQQGHLPDSLFSNIKAMLLSPAFRQTGAFFDFGFDQWKAKFNQIAGKRPVVSLYRYDGDIISNSEKHKGHIVGKRCERVFVVFGPNKQGDVTHFADQHPHLVKLDESKKIGLLKQVC